MDLLKSVVFAAVISGVVALIVSYVSARTANRINRDKIELDRELSEEKAKAELKLAERRFELERKLASEKRRAEVAEKVLSDFYIIRHSFEVIRSPMIWAGEMVPEEGVEVDVVTNDGYGVMRRIRHYQPQFAELEASRFTFAALFGGDAASPFATIVQTHNKVFHAAEALLRYRNQLDLQTLQDHLMRMRQVAFTMGAIGADGELLPDLIAGDIDEAVAKIEAICRPALESALVAWPEGVNY